jgi:hypothetical protein
MQKCESDVLETVARPDVSALPLAPKNPLPYVYQLKAAPSYIDGFQRLVDAGDLSSGKS